MTIGVVESSIMACTVKMIVLAMILGGVRLIKRIRKASTISMEVRYRHQYLLQQIPSRKS